MNTRTRELLVQRDSAQRHPGTCTSASNYHPTKHNITVLQCQPTLPASQPTTPAGSCPVHPSVHVHARFSTEIVARITESSLAYPCTDPYNTMNKAFRNQTQLGMCGWGTWDRRPVKASQSMLLACVVAWVLITVRHGSHPSPKRETYCMQAGKACGSSGSPSTHLFIATVFSPLYAPVSDPSWPRLSWAFRDEPKHWRGVRGEWQRHSLRPFTDARQL